MSVYTVHQPPLRGDDALADPERFAFVRDGFYVWAFLLTPLWMLWRRLWLWFVIAVALVAVLDAAALMVGVSASAVFAINTMFSLLIGFEASTLQRWRLRRRGWVHVGIVIGDDLESAERRFFDDWVDGAPSQAGSRPAAASAVAVPPPSPPRIPQSPEVIGLFPQPGAPR
jgi:hypothetical protein